MNIFISGGTRGIGNGLVRHFQELGHKVVYTGTCEDSINESVNKNLEGTFGCVCNVCNRKDIKAALDYALKTLGTIDVVINNAGVNQKSLPVAVIEGFKCSFSIW